MKKTLILLCSILVVYSCNNHQQTISENEISDAVTLLMKGITDADEGILHSITSDKLVYGHSSGKVQNKSEFISEVINGPLSYVNIELLDQTIKVSGETAIVRHIFKSETLNDGVPGNLKIGNVLIWQLQNREWKLLARQAYRLP